MKRYLTILLFLLLIQAVYAQLYDKTWICGNFAGRVTFENGYVDTSSYRPFINCYTQWANICNSDGDLQFFTEGVNVYNYDGWGITNGENLADPEANSHFRYGLPDFQNVFILPKKGDEYYVIYQSQSDQAFVNQPFFYTDNLYYAIVDMSLQNGMGAVTEKRRLVHHNNCMDGHMTACQHANGRDWWLVQRGYNNNVYYTYLVTPDSIVLRNTQTIGAISYEPDAVGQSEFSPDGSKYATITGKSPLIVLDFDRCQGIFNNPVSVRIPIDTMIFYGQQEVYGGGGNGLCFSPNNRFIYVNSYDVLRQYDLQQPIIDSSEQVIFLWTDTNEYLGQFNQMHLGPDGKIYIAACQGFTYALNTIDSPDQGGLACHFTKWGQPIAATSASQISNVVHYRMGALIGSACDTLQTCIKDDEIEINQIKVFPNPATDIVQIDLTSYNLYNPAQHLFLYNEVGQLVKQVTIPYLSAQFSVADLPTGIYHWAVGMGNKTNGKGTLNVVR